MTLRLKAPAKVNLVLRVGVRRADGYHTMASLMQTVSLYDEIEVSPARRGIVLEEHGGGGGVPSTADPKMNLAYRAALALQTATGCTQGIRIHLAKRIPVGAGLGGGSSDAGAVLLAANRLWGLALPRSDLYRVAITLGSDVPFFLAGPTAWVYGRGERLDAVAPPPYAWLVLACPDRKISTHRVYAAFDRTRPPAGRNGSLLRSCHPTASGGWPGILPYLRNDLEPITARIEPRLAPLKTDLIRLGAHGTAMSGSGPTVFGFFSRRSLAMKAAQVLAAQDGYRAWAVRTLRHRTRLGHVGSQ